MESYIVLEREIKGGRGRRAYSFVREYHVRLQGTKKAIVTYKTGERWKTELHFDTSFDSSMSPHEAAEQLVDMIQAAAIKPAQEIEHDRDFGISYIREEKIGRIGHGKHTHNIITRRIVSVDETREWKKGTVGHSFIREQQKENPDPVYWTAHASCGGPQFSPNYITEESHITCSKCGAAH